MILCIIFKKRTWISIGSTWTRYSMLCCSSMCNYNCVHLNHFKYCLSYSHKKQWCLGLLFSGKLFLWFHFVSSRLSHWWYWKHLNISCDPWLRTCISLMDSHSCSRNHNQHTTHITKVDSADDLIKYHFTLHHFKMISCKWSNNPQTFSIFCRIQIE